MGMNMTLTQDSPSKFPSGRSQPSPDLLPLNKLVGWHPDNLAAGPQHYWVGGRDHWGLVSLAFWSIISWISPPVRSFLPCFPISPGELLYNFCFLSHPQNLIFPTESSQKPKQRKNKSAAAKPWEDWKSLLSCESCQQRWIEEDLAKMEALVQLHKQGKPG